MVAEKVLLVDNLNMRKVLPLAISGILMVFVGGYMILRPDDFLSVVISILGLYIVFDGIRSIVSLVRYRTFFSSAVRTMAIIKAVLNTVIGVMIIVLAFANPSIILDIVVYIAATAFLLTAVINFIDCLVLSQADVGYGTLGLESVISFIASIMLFAFPGFIGSVIMTLFAAIILAAGAVMVYAAIMRYVAGKDENTAL